MSLIKNLKLKFTMKLFSEEKFFLIFYLFKIKSIKINF